MENQAELNFWNIQLSCLNEETVANCIKRSCIMKAVKAWWKRPETTESHD